MGLCGIIRLWEVHDCHRCMPLGLGLRVLGLVRRLLVNSMEDTLEDYGPWAPMCDTEGLTKALILKIAAANAAGGQLMVLQHKARSQLSLQAVQGLHQDAEGHPPRCGPLGSGRGVFIYAVNQSRESPI